MIKKILRRIFPKRIYSTPQLSSEITARVDWHKFYKLCEDKQWRDAWQLYLDASSNVGMEYGISTLINQEYDVP